uniref:Major intrinsically disordered Notch2-binding receptor 1-like C-terminal domain-containing protein n=1 Tax=Knipowitschia caucasica TaxID=637954 RepID=A0AAV2LTL6_KNICA
MGVKALKNSLMRRSSRSLNQEPAPDWSTTVYCTERPRTHREQEHPYEVSRIRPGPVDFPPPPFTPSRQKHLQSGPVYTDLSPAVKSSPVYSELRLDSTRLHPGWGSAEGYSRHPEQRPKQLKALDAQGGAALDPAHLEYWLEDVYSPGFDSLLRRKQADLRRARLCKLGALITAATCTLLLVIVVPICTMRT